MAEKRIGNQTPTQSVSLPYENTKGDEAIQFYTETGREAQEWQQLLIYDILAVDDEGLYVHTKFGYSVPRRNGKGEVITIRELYALEKGEKVLHTAHRTTTSSNASLRLVNLLKDRGYTEVQRVRKDEPYEKAYIYSKQFGLEKIVLLDTGGEVHFRTRTAKGGLGEGFDLLIVDEAQEYTDDQQSSLQYVVSDSDNPQILLCGTPPTAVSSGTVFFNLRNACLEGTTEDTGWAEWSVEFQSDVNDVELWYMCNPAMGYQLNERKVKAEDKTDEIDFNIQRLGLWLTYNQKSAISETEWKELEVETLPKLQKETFIGIKFGRDGANVSMSVAVKTNDERIFVECIDCQTMHNGIDWIVDYLDQMRPRTIAIDGANGQQMLQQALEEKGITDVVLPTVKDITFAFASFEQSIFKKTLCHANQESLTQCVSNCEKRIIGNGGFGYRSLKEHIDITLLESVAIARWLCAETKPKKKRRISY